MLNEEVKMNLQTLLMQLQDFERVFNDDLAID